MRNDTYAGASEVSNASYLRSPADYGYHGAQFGTYPENHVDYGQSRVQDEVPTSPMLSYDDVSKAAVIKSLRCRFS